MCVNEGTAIAGKGRKASDVSEVTVMPPQEDSQGVRTASKHVML